MYWSWASGYIFYKFEGEVDYDGDEVPDASFGYHVGLNNFLIQREEVFHMDVTAGEEVIFNLNFDYALLFDGLDLNTELSTHTMNNIPLATKIRVNVEKAVSLSSGNEDGDHSH